MGVFWARGILRRMSGSIVQEPTIRGEVDFGNNVGFVRDFTVIGDLDRFDVMIGRDILKHCRFYLDLGQGHFRLYIPQHQAKTNF